MTFTKKIAAVAVMSAVSLPMVSQAGVDLFAVAKMSVDRMSDGANKSTSVNSNASRFGLKGNQDLANGMKAGFYAEFGFDMSGESSTFGTRNRYVSLGGDYGTVMVGNYDTFFKQAVTAMDPFADYAGDARNVLGVNADGANRMNTRAKNAVVYVSPKFADMLQFNALYSTAYNAIATSNMDDKNNSLYDLGVTLEKGALAARAVFEHQSDSDNKGAVANGGNNGVRISAVYTIDATKLGLIAENLHGGDAKLNRSAYGVNVVHRFGDTSVKAEVIQVGDVEGISDSGALDYSVGVFQALDKNLEVYALYNATNNKSAAKYNAGAPAVRDGNASSFAPASVGADPSDLSVGVVYKF